MLAGQCGDIGLGPRDEPFFCLVSCFTVFLGVDLDLAARGFGRSNVSCYPDIDLDTVIDRTVIGQDYSAPFFFLSTPSLYADPGVLAPAGSTTGQINVGSSYKHFVDAKARGLHEAERERVCAQILAAVERRLIPGLREHIVTKEAWTPVDLSQRTGLARGGMYGARLDLLNRVIRRVVPQTDCDNLHLTGATAGSSGMAGVVSAGMRLAQELLQAQRPANPNG